MWAIALNEGVNANNLVYFLFPSMIFSASNTSRDATAIRDVNDVERCIHDYIDSRRDFAEIKNDIAEKVNNYQKAVSEWFSKSQLADKVINSCPDEELPYLYDVADPIRTLSQRREKAEINAKQLYMNGWVKPCKTAPESLGDEYQRLTENVADGFREIDRYLIFTALDSLVSDDKKFITSPDTSIYPVSFTMKTNKPMITAYGVAKDVDVHVRLDKTDLFSVIHDGEERIYALKADSHDNMLHYNLIRVDRQIERYIDSGILDHNGFESNTVVEGNVLRTAEDTFYFSIFTKTSSPYPKGNNEKVIIDKLSSSHREVLYQRLYAEGNSLSDIQNLWKVIKNFIPFYECISGVANNDPVQAVPSCLLDAFSLIPVIGHVLKLSSKFGMGLASGIHKGSHVLRHGSRFTARQVLLNDIVMPKTSELRLLGKHTLNVLDPGFELIGGIGRKFSTELINLLRKDAKTTELAERIAFSGVLERSLLPQKPVVFARFPGSEIEIAMQQVGSDAEQGVYAMVNTDTGEMGGEYFHLQQGNILKGISGVKLKENGFVLNERFSKQDRHGERKLPKALKRKTNLLFHYPRRRTEHSYSAPNANLRGGRVTVDVPRLKSFLPLRADFDFINKEFIDYTEYKSFALELSFPNTHEEIINMENAFSLMHIQRVSESEIMIPEVFSQFKNNFDLYKIRLNNAMLLVDNVMMEFDTLFHSHTLSAENVNLRDNVINEYLKNVLATESPDVLRNAVERLSLALNRISDYFVNYEEKVYLVTTKRNDISSSDRPKVFGFTNIKDSQKRIVIFTDSFDTGRGYNDDMVLTMIHEATHAELGTQDFFYSPYTKLVGDPEDIPEALVEQLTGADTRAPLNLDNQFLDAYATHMGIERPDIESFKQMILNDDMLKANIIMDNADSLSNIIIDIHKLLLPSRVTRNVQSSPSQSHSFDHLTLKALIGLVATESGAR
ncbi:hypothetical protein [Symbiopectobacterium purcellii]|uniref:Uncharacterized protein n=1 Tax=Symbiopectobacterium purcellii TaxID=2871826 RepID=A0ABX9AQD2_9ENTR|nr:hypothetical protein [Symbiopectobacterium purcellii]QZN97268.1 hypothetical protein K6K13_07930 [Symbiopectobacterium purcellii]